MADSLKALPEHYSEVIVLRHFERLSLAEVALRVCRMVPDVPVGAGWVPVGAGWGQFT